MRWRCPEHDLSDLFQGSFWAAKFVFDNHQSLPVFDLCSIHRSFLAFSFTFLLTCSFLAGLHSASDRYSQGPKRSRGNSWKPFLSLETVFVETCCNPFTWLQNGLKWHRCLHLKLLGCITLWIFGDFWSQEYAVLIQLYIWRLRLVLLIATCFWQFLFLWNFSTFSQKLRQ